jgi:hypothetical protein
MPGRLRSLQVSRRVSLRRWRGAAFGLAVLLPACHAAHLSSRVSSRNTVPPISPDSTPYALFDSLGSVSSAPGVRFPWIRSIVAVGFRAGTSQSDRQSAVDQVNGIVVGGIRFRGEDGDYFLRIPDATFAGIQKAIAIERALPQVAIAHPLTRDSMYLEARQRAKKPR